MTDASNSAQIKNWLTLFADRVQEHQAYLTTLDEAIGDADHGDNLQRATDILRQRFALLKPDVTSRSPDELLRLIGITLLNHTGGAAGPLYGAFFFHAAHAAKQAPAHALDQPTARQLSTVASWFAAGLYGIQSRGMVTGGEKTMADALLPAVQSLQHSTQAQVGMQEAMEHARTAAYAGMQQTAALKATKGRASYLGARTIGHQDPGATSIYLLIETAAEVFGNLDRSQQSISA